MKRIIVIFCLALLSAGAAAQEIGFEASVKDNPRLWWRTVPEVIRDSVYYQKNPMGKVEYMKKMHTSAGISLPKTTAQDREYEAPKVDMSRYRDTITIKNAEGQDMLLMRAIKDETGEMVANEVLDAAVVTARFRNVAERHGRIALEFDITVPERMMDTNWQLRFFPRLRALGDVEELDPVYITGQGFRRSQIKGYMQYQKFIDSIINDPSKFVNIDQLEKFLARNLPQIYYFKTDSTAVSDEQFRSYFGVTEKQAIDHYTDKFRVRMNDRRIARKDKMYRKYVKAPIDSLGLRLDTVMRAVNGDFIYCYTHTMETQKDLKKVEIALAGSIHDQEKQLYSIPQSEPLTFYIASLSSFADQSPHYLLQVVERHAEANASYNVAFEVGRSEIKPSLGDNASEIAFIKKNIAHLLKNEEFILDSIVVTSYASPEGSRDANWKLCGQRSVAFSKYFNKYIREFKDSLLMADGIKVNLGGAEFEEKQQDVRFVSVTGGENWRTLDQLVEIDKVLSDDDKADYFELSSIDNVDLRETRLRSKPYHKYIKESLYPQCRVVTCGFQLHRMGMTKDTVMTKVLDTLYMRGVQALVDRDYDTAVDILRPYQDYNAAVALCAKDYNLSAMQILEDLPKDAKVEYMLALLYGRQNNDQEAVQHFMNAVNMEPSYQYRGNLDPEIRVLIDRYQLFKEDDSILEGGY